MRIVQRIVPGLIAIGLLSTSIAASVSGDPFDIGRFEGQVVVVDFWASWCAPCRRSFPWMNAMQEKYGDQGLKILAVNEDSDWQAAEQFLADYPAIFDVLHDRDGAIAKQFNLQAMPTTYVFDRSGELVHRHFGFKTRRVEEYELAIRSTLGVEPGNGIAGKNP